MVSSVANQRTAFAIERKLKLDKNTELAVDVMMARNVLRVSVEFCINLLAF